MQPFTLGALTPRLFVVSTTTGNLVSPIVVTTTVTHSFVSGDFVTISAVTGNTAANGTWAVGFPTVTTLALFSVSGAASTGNGAYVSGGQISAPTQLGFAANDSSASPKVSKIYFEAAFANANVALVGLAGINQSTLAKVIRQLNKTTLGGGRLDFYNLDGTGDNIFTLNDYWIDCVAPSTDAVIATYWRG
jgi:hypothetical protein